MILKPLEKKLLQKALDDGYNWIVRDPDNKLFVFKYKPSRLYGISNEIWVSETYGFEDFDYLNNEESTDNLLWFITIRDKQPTEIKHLLGGNFEIKYN